MKYDDNKLRDLIIYKIKMEKNITLENAEKIFNDIKDNYKEKLHLSTDHRIIRYIAIKILGNNWLEYYSQTYNRMENEL